MKTVFGDSDYYVAQKNRLDSGHRKAQSFSLRYAGRYVTTEYVLVETANFLRLTPARTSFVQLVRELKSDRRTTIVPASTDLFDRGLALFAARPDKDWSLTDCISFVVMKDLHLAEALTGDHHFEQAGFTALLS